ncbi:MAG: DUF1836 domain-containing protein [Clostridia bacterium]|nr:DUF1836 domain-containing protein [Clostridia bacterium]
MAEEMKLSYTCPTWSDFPDIDLYMDQVISVLERYLAHFFPQEEKCITSTMINNYVKHHLLPPPENKRYSRRHLARLFMICIFKRFVQLSEIQIILENLVKEKGEEGTYLLFKEELESAFLKVYQGETFGEREVASSGEGALRYACIAFAAIIKARDVFVAAGFPPLVTEEKKEEKEKKDKPKEKDKAKEKKEPKKKEKAKKE